MQHAHRSRLIILILGVLLMGAAIGLAILYPRATRSLAQPQHQPLVQRAEQEAAATFHHSPEYQRRITFPVVMELSDRTCVELRSTAADGAGNYLACYSPSGQVLEERATAGF
jgi:flagellar basal body-associated protein FliL